MPRPGPCRCAARSITCCDLLQFLGGQLFFLLPALVIAAPLFWPRSGNKNTPSATADAFDRRIVTLLAFGPALTVFAFSLVTGRGTVTMWGYPLWLFLGLWIVLFAPAALDRARLVWIGVLWATVFAILAVAFCADYPVLPRIDHRYRAAFFPGGALRRRDHATVRGWRPARSPPTSSLSMWNGGNVAHYSGLRPQPRVLIDGVPHRAPWIDLADLRTRGAVVVWTDGDPHVRCRRACRGRGRRRNRRAVRSAVPQRRARAARGLGGAAPRKRGMFPAETDAPLRPRVYLCRRRCYLPRTDERSERRNAELPEA